VLYVAEAAHITTPYDLKDDDIAFTTEPWPPDYDALQARRDTALENLRSKTGNARHAMLQQAYAHYRSNPIAFIEDWLRTYDPRNLDRPFMPFILFDRQKEYVYWMLERLQKREGGLAEKSRDMGISYLSCGFSVWAWRFIPGVKIGFGSNKEVKVDRLGDLDSLFEKLRVMIQDLPAELLPVGYKKRDHSHFMKLINPETKGSITGEAGNNIGRGGRTTIYFVDESAHLEQPGLIDAALSANTDIRIDVSSVNGMGNPFYRRRHGGQVPGFVFDWRQDPRKTQAWYDKKCATEEPHVVAQEIDRDYTASVEGICIPGKWVLAAQEISSLVDIPESQVGKGGLDVGAGGSGKSCFIARFGPVVRKPVTWGQPNTTVTAIKSIELATMHGVKDVNFDSVGVGTGVSSTLALDPNVDAEGADEKIGGSLAAMTARKQSVKKIPTYGINTGQEPSHRVWEDGKRSKEKFVNLKAELWWIARDRFQKTYEVVQFIKGKDDGHQHPLDECIVIPRDAFELASQLSQVKVLDTQGGKLIMESKKQLESRGIKSPDEAEALVLTLYEQPVATRRKISV
jgi:phage terminase large subunit